MGLEESEHPECLLLDVTGLGPLFQGEERLMELVAREFRQHGWQARLALADTISAAWALAHYAVTGAGEKSTAEIIAPAGKSLAALARLPIAALRLAGEQAQLLKELGLAQIGQLEVFRRSALATRLGPELLRRWDQVTGAANEVIRAVGTSPRLEAGWSCEEPITHSEVIEAIIERLLERLTATLARDQRGAVQLTVRIVGGRQVAGGGRQAASGSENAEFSIGLYRPSATPRYLFELLRMKLERMKLAEPVTEIHVAVTASEPLECRQKELFETPTRRDDPRELATLVDRLSSRLGRKSVLRAWLSSNAQPEYAWRYRAAGGSQTSSSRCLSAQREPIARGWAIGISPGWAIGISPGWAIGISPGEG